MSAQPENPLSTQKPAEGRDPSSDEGVVAFANGTAIQLTIERYNELIEAEARDKWASQPSCEKHLLSLCKEMIALGMAVPESECSFCSWERGALNRQPAAPTPPVARCEHCGMDLVAHHSRNLKCPNAATVYRATPPVASPIEARGPTVLDAWGWLDKCALGFDGNGVVLTDKQKIAGLLTAYYAACRSKEKANE